MKYTDLTPEERKHFDSVVDYYGEDFPEDATHVDFDGDPDTDFLLLKETDEGAFFWDSFVEVWERDTYPAENYYQIPDKPWYNPDDVSFNKEISGIHKKRVNELTLKAMQEPLEDCETLGSIDELFEEDMVNKPNHYQLLPEYEVKDVMKALLDKIEESDFKMTYYEAGWYQQSMQYFLRFYAKNGLEDIEKGLETMQFVVDSIKQRKEEVQDGC